MSSIPVPGTDLETTDTEIAEAVNSYQTIINATSTTMNLSSLASFISSDLEFSLETIPGVGKITSQKLKDAGIYNSFALIGKFLTLYTVDESGEHPLPKKVPELFIEFLLSIGVDKKNSKFIARAVTEKVLVMMPGFMF